MLYLQFPSWITPEVFGIPFLRWYGLMYLLAFGMTYWLFQVQVRQRQLAVDPEEVTNLFFWTIVGLLIGARLFATLLFDESGIYWRQPWLIFWPFRNGQFVGLQGMNFYGGLVGGAIAGVWYMKKRQLDMLQWADMLFAGIPAAYTFGRLGNFINAELYGRVTQAPWGVVFPTAQRFPASAQWVQDFAADIGMSIAPDQLFVNLPRHPTQIYEMLTEGVLAWLIIWFLVKDRNPFPGFIMSLYIGMYGVFRFIIDYFRMPLGSDFALRLSAIENPPYLLLTPWNFIASQFYSFAMIVASVIMMIVFSRMHRTGMQAGS